MSTYEPPGGQPPEGGPGYAQPQDPWADYNPGVASVPTDPIPQQHDPYYAQQPGYGEADPWGAPTVQHGGPQPGQPGWVPQQEPKRSALPIVFTVLAVVLLAGGGGYAAWYVANSRDTPQTQPSASTSTSATQPTESATTTETTSDPTFNAQAVTEGTCVRNINPDPASKVEMRVVECDKGAWKVIKKASGEEIPENDAGKFDRDTTSVEVCRGTGYTHWYGYQDREDDSRDVFLCLEEQR